MEAGRDDERQRGLEPVNSQADRDEMTIESTAAQHASSATPALMEEGEVAKAPNADVSGTPWSIWSSKQRKFIILSASFASLLSPLSGQIYYPALGTIAKDLHVTDSQVNISITTFLIFQAIAPTFTAQLSDTIGRRPLYFVCFVLYLAANIGLGAQNNYVALLVLRAFQSAGSSGTAALASAVATDITTPGERGSYIAYAAAIPMLGPTVGPIIGGLLAQYCGWHSIFWFLVGLTGAVAVPMAVFFPETCRAVVGDGSIPPQRWNRCYTNVRSELAAAKQGRRVPYSARDELSASRPFQWPNPVGSVVLLLRRECGFALLYSSVLCCSFYAVLSLIPSQFRRVYRFDELQISLCYIPFGAGSLVAAFNRGRMLDSNFGRHAGRLGLAVEKNQQVDLAGFPIERARLEVALPTILLGSACTVGFGWTLGRGTNPAGPLVFLFVVAFCVSSSLNTVACLMLDIFPDKAGTVSASNNLLRCGFGAAATAAVVPLIDAVGVGWALTMFALLPIAALPTLWYIVEKGPGWRAETARKKSEAEEKARGTDVVQGEAK